MSHSTPSTTTAHSAKRSTKLKAILTGGIVLGVGAAITLAAWNDSEFATGTFGSGAFNIEGSTDGTTFSEHDSSGSAATLQFEVDADNISPGETVYAPFAVRIDDASSYDADVSVNAVAGGDVDGLTYSVVAPGSFECDDATTGDSVVGSTAIADGTDVGSFSLTQGTGGQAGDAENLCIAVTADDSISQGQSGTLTLEFAAESK